MQAGREAYGGHVSKVWWVGVVCNVRKRESSEDNRKQEMNGEKKTNKSGKKRGWKKKKKIGEDGPREDRPFDPFRLSLRAALWTIGTSGKAPYACKRASFASYRNLVSTEVCVINKKTVLLIVLLYCYSSTMPA